MLLPTLVTYLQSTARKLGSFEHHWTAKQCDRNKLKQEVPRERNRKLVSEQVVVKEICDANLKGNQGCQVLAYSLIMGKSNLHHQTHTNRKKEKERTRWQYKDINSGKIGSFNGVLMQGIVL